MPDLPLVSVIIPLYNAANYIEECITSVLAQTWPNIEIIIVDDGSTDDSLAAVKKFNGEKVKIFSQINSGASVARNHGLQQAKGEYIQFMDADDLLSNDKIEAQLKILEHHPGYLAVCDTVHFKDGEDPHSKKRIKEWFTEGAANSLDFLIKLYGGLGSPYGGMIQPNAWLTPRTLIDKAGLWNPMRCPDDDGEFFCRVLLASEGVKYAAEGVNYYRKFIGKHSLSSRRTYESRYSVLQSWILKSEHLKPYETVPGVKKALAFNFTELCYSYYTESPELSRTAAEWAGRYGGLTHPPWFGNRFFNKFRRLLPWKTALFFQKIYQGVKSN